jgi:hypothetical protein
MVFILLPLLDAGGFAQGGCQSPMVRCQCGAYRLVDLGAKARKSH